MNETARTGVFAAVAAVSIVAALLLRPAAPEREAFDDSGERFFAEADPLAARSLEVVAYDPTTASVQVFKVANVGGRWSIPSHDDYPADDDTQLSGAAASVLDLVKGPKVSDRAADHELYGVVDPLSDEAAGESAGTRVSVKGETGETMVDLIIGKPVKDGRDLRYVRLPDRDRVYTATVTTSALTTKFEAWIEDDLLRLDPSDVKQIMVNDYTVDEVNRRLVPRDTLTLREVGGSWTLDGLGANEELEVATVDAMKRALDDLKIIDVRRKPEGLGAELRAEDTLQLDQTALQSLSRRGFYIANNALVSNQGETVLGLDSGVTYVLRFGEIASGRRGDAGLDEAEETGAVDESGANDEEGAARYLFVMAEFDERLRPPPEYEAVPELPPGAETATEGEEPSAADADLEEMKTTRELIIKANDVRRQEYEKDVADARTTVRELNDRFADWYYVISDSVYKQIRVSREGLVKAAAGAAGAEGP